MARFAVAGRTGSALTSVLGPIVVPTTAVRPQIREIGVFNTTTTACAVAVCRSSAIGTPGSALTEICLSDDSNVAIAVGTNIGTGAYTVGAPVRQATLGAAAGSGIIWTWEDGGFILDNVAAIGVTVICPTGTGQIVDFYIEWKE